MLSRLFVLNVANLCSCPFNENILKTNNEKAINLKSRKMTKIKIVVHKKDALKKVLKVFHWILWQLVKSQW